MSSTSPDSARDVGILQSEGIDVYGHFNTPCGLRVSADNTVAMLGERGVPVRLHTIYAERERSVEPAAGARRSRVNIFHVNPVTVLGLLTDRHESPRWQRRLNICVPYWELPRVPDSWLPVLRGMDLVLAPTRFIAEAITASDPDIVVEHFPQTVFLRPGIEPDRTRFGFAEGATVFGTSFAAQAVTERKNPWAVIEAFQLAFPTEPDVRLVVRAYDAGQGDASPLLGQASRGGRR